MTITRETKTRYLLNILNGEQVRYVLDNIPPQPLEVPLLAMTVNDWLAMTTNAEAAVAKFTAEPLAYLAFGRLRQWRLENEKLQRYLKRYELQQTAEEQQASVGVPFPTPTERVITTLVKYYRLHSTAEAGRLTVADYITAYKDLMSEAIYQRKLTNIQAKKYSHGSKLR